MMDKGQLQVGLKVQSLFYKAKGLSIGQQFLASYKQYL